MSSRSSDVGSDVSIDDGGSPANVSSELLSVLLATTEAGSVKQNGVVLEERLSASSEEKSECGKDSDDSHSLSLSSGETDHSDLNVEPLRISECAIRAQGRAFRSKPVAGTEDTRSFTASQLVLRAQGQYGWRDREQQHGGKFKQGQDSAAWKPSYSAPRVSQEWRNKDWRCSDSALRRIHSDPTIDDSSAVLQASKPTTLLKSNGSRPHSGPGTESAYKSRYRLKSEPKTRNGIPWHEIHRGHIIIGPDLGRAYVGHESENNSTIFKIDGRLRMFKTRPFLVVDRLTDHLDVRPITTHSGRGLKSQAAWIGEDSMCIVPFDEAKLEGWENEAAPNEVLRVKALLADGAEISPMPSVRASQGIMINRDEEIVVVAEMGEEDVRQVETLYQRLKEESRD